MQIIQSKSNFVEKIIRDKDGRLVRATFCVYENGGRIKARLVEYVYITFGAISGKILSLSNNLSNGIFDTKKRVFASRIPSLFFIQNSIFYFGSKPRAPTL